MKLKNLISGTGAILLALAAQSCLDREYQDAIFPNAVVTVRPDAEQNLLMQLDDSTTLKATNIAKSPYKDKTVRALVVIAKADFERIVSDRERTSEPKQYEVEIRAIDSIRTKALAPDLGEKNTEIYGNDPLDLINSFATVAEDGYLTLRFSTMWGGMYRHELNLVADTEDPYKVRLFQHSHGDFPEMRGDGLIAFDLSSLPDTGGEYVTLTVAWEGFDGPKEAQFRYKSVR